MTKDEKRNLRTLDVFLICGICPLSDSDFNSFTEEEVVEEKEVSQN